MPAGPFVAYEIRSHAGGAAPAKLNTTMAVDALSFVLQAGQGASYPDGSGGPFHMSLDFGSVGMEHVRVSTRSGDTFNLNSLGDRGLMGTTPLQHAQGAAVSHGWSALESDEVIATAHNTLGRISAKGDMLYADTATTLAAFAKGTAGQSPVYQADSSVAAGNPIPAPHTHVPADIIGLAPGLLTTAFSASTYTITGSNAALDTTNLTVSFTVPASGSVLTRATGLFLADTSGNYAEVWWAVHGGSTMKGIQQKLGAGSTGSQVFSFAVSVAQKITGLAPSTTVQLDLWGGATGTSSQQFSDVLLEVIGI